MEFKNVKSIIGPNGKDVTKITRTSDNVILWQKGNIYSNLQWLTGYVNGGNGSAGDGYLPIVYLDKSQGDGANLWNKLVECRTNNKTIQLRFLSTNTVNGWYCSKTTPPDSISLCFSFVTWTTAGIYNFNYSKGIFTIENTATDYGKSMLGKFYKGTTDNNWSTTMKFSTATSVYNRYLVFGMGNAGQYDGTCTTSAAAETIAQRQLEYSTLNGCSIELQVIS